MKIKNHNADFKEVLAYCRDNNLFVGEGNPNSKILLIGKEINPGESNLPEINPLDVICNISGKDVQRNLKDWNTQGGYDVGKIQSDIWRDGRHATWMNYQKLTGGIIGSDLGRSDYRFLDHCFMTEMNDIHLPYSAFGGRELRPKINEMRRESVGKRAKLFAMPFFRQFVIMACGHYPKMFGFDIEKGFGVRWEEKESYTLGNGNFCNVHRGDGKIVIHTRQMSNGVSNALIDKIAALCRPFYETITQ